MNSRSLVLMDTTKPALVSATVQTNTSVKVVFSEPMDETLKTAVRYYFGSELDMLRSRKGYQP